MQDNPDKIILKEQSWPGVDKSFNDRSMWCTMPQVQLKVTKGIYKVKTAGFIGLKGRVLKGEVIKVGRLGFTYKVVGDPKPTEKEGFIHKIVRTCGEPIRQLDIDAVKVGKIAIVVSRQTRKDRINLDKNQYQIIK